MHDAGSLPPVRPGAPPGRRSELAAVCKRLLGARRVVLTTHVNADGDGAGSMAAVAHWLENRGVETRLVVPTPFPESFAFLVEEIPVHLPEQPEGREALERAGTLAVLDTSEPSRMGRLADWLERVPTVVVVDHHPPSAASVGDPACRDVAACATGELVFDMLEEAGETLTPAIARALWVAIVSDTGSFRFGNTSARALRIGARLLEAGVDVQAMYRHLFSRFTPEGLELLRRALATLEVDDRLPVAWIVVHHGDVAETGAGPEDREGLVEYARRMRDVEVAFLLRELPEGRTKVSLRSNGRVDVAALARELGGGGHPMAAGALIDTPLGEARRWVLERVRSATAAALA